MDARVISGARSRAQQCRSCLIAGSWRGVGGSLNHQPEGLLLVDDPEHASRRGVGLAGYDLLDEAAERVDPGLRFDAVEQGGAMDVPGGQVRRACRRARTRTRPAPGGPKRREPSAACARALAAGTPRRRRRRTHRGAGACLRRPAHRGPRRGPAFQAKSASRGKIHDLVCQGLRASSCGQRQIVDADASAAPRSITRRCSSVRENRPSGRPCMAGNSHAIASPRRLAPGENGAGDLNAACPSTPAGAALRIFVASAPPDRMRCQAGRDLAIGHALSGIEHDPRTLHVLERQLLRSRDPLKAQRARPR